MRLGQCTNPFVGRIYFMWVSKVTALGQVEEATPFPVDLEEGAITPMIVDESLTHEEKQLTHAIEGVWDEP